MKVQEKEIWLALAAFAKNRPRQKLRESLGTMKIGEREEKIMERHKILTSSTFFQDEATLGFSVAWFSILEQILIRIRSGIPMTLGSLIMISDCIFRTISLKLWKLGCGERASNYRCLPGLCFFLSLSLSLPIRSGKLKPNWVPKFPSEEGFSF